MGAKLEVKQDNLQQAMQAVARMTGKEALVGVTDSTNQRSDSEFGNAGIAYEAEFGSPACNIPMRPFLGPGLESKRKDISRVLEVGARLGMEGDLESVNNALEVAGNIGRAGAVEKIQEGNFVPLAESTIKARARSDHPGAAGARVAAANYDKFLASTKAGQTIMGKPWLNFYAPPLIDTGAFIQSITYVVRDKKR